MPTQNPPALLESTSSSSSIPNSQTKEAKGSSGFYFFLLLLAVVMAGVGVFRLGGIEKTKLHLREFIGQMKNSAGGVGSYSQVGGLPR